MSGAIDTRRALRQDMGSVLTLVTGTGALALISTPYVHGALVLFVLNAILVLSYRTITTMGGWSFAHVAIMGVGAYAVGLALLLLGFSVGNAQNLVSGTVTDEGKEPLKELGQCPVYFSLRCTERNILPFFFP